jgi:hypothetical protein
MQLLLEIPILCVRMTIRNARSPGEFRPLDFGSRQVRHSAIYRAWTEGQSTSSSRPCS